MDANNTKVNADPLLPAKITSIVLVLAFTNEGAIGHLRQLIIDGRLRTAVLYTLLWIFTFATILTAGLYPRLRHRLAWAIPFSLATGIGYGFFKAQSSDISFIDVLTFWHARHEVGRAMIEYSGSVQRATMVALVFFVVMAVPPGIQLATARWQRLLFWVPILPVVLITTVIFIKEGRGTVGLPKQVTPLSYAMTLGILINTKATQSRKNVAITPGAPLARAVVLLVDESIRADHLSLAAGNAITPRLAEVGSRWIDFGPSVSGANCSSTSNAVLRFMVDHRMVSTTAKTNPTIWSYARAAGYRTVYIDAQSALIGSGVKLQNFMTLAESHEIESFHRIDNSVPVHLRDQKVSDIILEELRSGGRVFIMANKNGAHVPYHFDYPPEGNAAVYVPATVDDLVNSRERSSARLESYVKAVQWSVDRELARLTTAIDWTDNIMIYTSDHGQNFAPGRLTHCGSAQAVDPIEGVVPLMIATGIDDLARRFRAAAAACPGHASHFAIPPTLLEIMGYRVEDVRAIYDQSLLGEMNKPPAFLAGDIFGMVSDVAEWHAVPDSLLERC